MNATPDLFATTCAPGPAVPVPSVASAAYDDPLTFITPPTLAWAKLLTRVGVRRIAILVSWLWKGEVVETISDGPAGRWCLHRDGTIVEIAADPGAFSRTVFRDPRLAEELHRRHPMIRVGRAGTHSATYRFAAAREPAPELLDLPSVGSDL